MDPISELDKSIWEIYMAKSKAFYLCPENILYARAHMDGLITKEEYCALIQRLAEDETTEAIS